MITHEFLPEKKPVKIVLTSGASCPDTLVDKVLLKMVGLFDETRQIEEVIADY